MPREYSLLPSHELPQNPPSYADQDAPMLNNANNTRQDDAESDSDSMSDIEANINFEQFEIDDPNNNIYTRNDRGFGRTQNFFQRANSVSRSLRSGFSSKIVLPMTRFLDPIAETWRFISIKFDVYLGKVGNPLILKRFLYVFFISGLIYLVITSGLYPSSKALINGQFNDQDVLMNFVRNHIDPKAMEESLEYLSSLPHMAGTAGDLALARYVNNIYVESGISPKEFNEVKSFVNYPDFVKLELKSSGGSYEAKLMEDVPVSKHEGQETQRVIRDINGKRADNSRSNLPMKSFNFLSADGKVEGPIMYVNYGREKDFELLQKNNINFDQAICFAKYGKISASAKLRIAHDKGCGAMVYFKDPKNLDLKSDDARNAIEKQMVSASEYSSGDVLTPGWPSIDSNPRLSWDKSETSPKIPSIPISYSDMIAFMKALSGKGLKIDTNKYKDWAFDNDQMITELGSSDVWSGTHETGDVKGYLEVQTSKRETKPLWNIVGKITGGEQSEKAVIIGAQRDSACFGAVNPNTGTTVLLEMVKVFTLLQKKLNWEPLRSIYFISIDGTEYNYAGITEWIEERFREIRKEAYAYIDLSDAINGKDLQIKSHPAFESVIMNVLKKVEDPNDKRTSNKNDNNNPKIGDKFDAKNIQSLNHFGNFYPFTSFVGTPSIEIKYGDNLLPKDAYSFKYPKNSCFDTFKRFQDLKVDPNMDYHRALVEVLSNLVIKLIDEPSIPYSLNTFYSKINAYLLDLEDYCHKVSNEFIKEKDLDFSPLRNANDYLSRISDNFNDWARNWKTIVDQENGGIEPSLLSVHRWEWNAKLIYLLRFPITDSGIAKRPWVKNMLFGPQLHEPEELKDDQNEEHFEWWTFPSIRDAVESKNWQAAQNELNKLAGMLTDSAVDFLNS